MDHSYRDRTAAIDSLTRGVQDMPFSMLIVPVGTGTRAGAASERPRKNRLSLPIYECGVDHPSHAVRCGLLADWGWLDSTARQLQQPQGLGRQDS